METRKEIKLVEYQTGGYIISEGIEKLFDYLIKNHYFGRSLDGKKHTQIILDCEGIIRVKHGVLKMMGDFEAGTGTEFLFEKVGFLKERNYKSIIEKQKRKKLRLLGKYKRLADKKEDLFEKFEYASRNGGGSLLKTIFTDLFNYETEAIKNCLKNFSPEQNYLKESREYKLKTIIQHLCKDEDRAYRKLESILLKVLERSNGLDDFEKKRVYILNMLNKIRLIDRNRFHILSPPLKNEYGGAQNLEDIILDTIGLIRFLYDSPKKHKWLTIREKDAVKSQRLLRKLLESVGEKIFKEYEPLTN